MTEDQILALHPGDIVHIVRNENCTIWIIDYKIDKYKAHAVQMKNLVDFKDGYYSTWFGYDTPVSLELVHLERECPHSQESQV